MTYLTWIGCGILVIFAGCLVADLKASPALAQVSGDATPSARLPADAAARFSASSTPAYSPEDAVLRFHALKPRQKVSVIEELVGTKSGGWLNLIRECLLDEDATVRAAAAVAVGVLQDKEAAPLLRNWVREAGRTPAERAGAIRGLAFLRDKDLGAELSEIAVDTAEDREVRKSALESLFRLNGDLAKPVLLACLSDKDPGILLTAIIGVRETSLEEAVPKLAEILNESEHPDYVRIHAAWALAGLRSPRALASLTRATRLPDEFIAVQAADQLSRADANGAEARLLSLRARVEGDRLLEQIVNRAMKRVR